MIGKINKFKSLKLLNIFKISTIDINIEVTKNILVLMLLNVFSFPKSFNELYH